MINNKVNKIEYQTFISKQLVIDSMPSVLFDTKLLLLEIIVSTTSCTIADGSATR